MGTLFPARPRLPARTKKASSKMANYELRCRECGKSWGNQPRSICDDCFSPLEVSYDYEAVRGQSYARAHCQPPSQHVAV